MNAKGPSDETLVARTRQGNMAAFDTLARRHYRASYAVALAVLCRHADAEDACHDAWLRALEKLDTCRKPERFVYWLLQIVRNRARNLLDARRVRAAEPLESSFGAAAAVAREDPGQDHARSQLRTRLEATLAKLSEVHRAIVLLHDLDGWSHREIAEMMGISEVMSRQHLFQARRRLRRILGGVGLEK